MQQKTFLLLFISIFFSSCFSIKNGVNIMNSEGPKYILDLETPIFRFADRMELATRTSITFEEEDFKLYDFNESLNYYLIPFSKNSKFNAYGGLGLGYFQERYFYTWEELINCTGGGFGGFQLCEVKTHRESEKVLDGWNLIAQIGVNYRLSEHSFLLLEGRYDSKKTIGSPYDYGGIVISAGVKFDLH